MNFLDDKNMENFKSILMEDNTNPKDVERQSLFYIIAGNEDLYSKRKHIYDFAERAINPECLESSEVDFSSSSRALIRLGYNLYNSYSDKYTTPIDILYGLDSDNYVLALNSLDIRFGVEREMEICSIDEGKENEDYCIGG
ncbi:DUF6075 family protein [Maledivibacter halophilus]|uniref:Uncharacterized protein n=1 Tax=Maledivibacter halophilus TaxID=36842 RepID=A0A1T5KSA7_9FIRM|nr:DUF6075 family protein [Maledivibacter halophilus]SKC66571.1 hypothetical protein SAMN02194393_02114 [Maledivibacter halophilus]